MKFAVYNKATGEILCHMQAPPDHVDIQCKEGQEFFLDCPEDATHIINGVPVKKALELPLSEWKDLARDRIADCRWKAETAGVVVNGFAVKTDHTSLARLASVLTEMKEGTTSKVSWKGAHGWASLKRADVEAVVRATSEHVQRCFDREMELSARIDAATSKEELDAIQW